MNKQTVVRPYIGIGLGNKKEPLINTTTFIILKGVMLREKKYSEKVYILYNFIYWAFSKRGNYRTRKQVTGCQRLEVRGRA